MTTIKGIYNKTLYRNKATGLTSFIFNLNAYDDNGNKSYICKGKIPSYAPGSPLILSGKLLQEEDALTFKVEESDYNTSETGMLLSFIKACLPAGMGEKKAEEVLKLLVALKMPIEEFVEYDKALDYMLTLNGFNMQSAVSFINKVSGSLIEKELFYSLARFGIKFSQASKLCDRYGVKVKGLIKENPYEILYGIGISFSRIDVYAKENGYDYCDENRIKALVNVTLLNVMACGHAFVSAEEFKTIFRRTERLTSAFEEQVPMGLVYLEICQNKGLMVEDDKIYVLEALKAENEVVAGLKRLSVTSQALISKDKIEIYKEKAQELDETQKTVLDLLEDTKPCSLVGGPGTGKTTTIKRVIECFKEYCPNKRYALIAPTGRAAQRIKESSGEEALTIHMLLEYYFLNGEGMPYRDEKNPLDVDFIIVDESSMVGLFLFNSLLKALKDGTKLMIVGDWNQLQSVEPGALLHDIVESKKFKTVFLTKVHRQSESSSIVKTARTLINDGIWEEDGDEIKVYHCKNNEEGRLLTKELYLSITKEEKNDDCIVICPQRKGDYGIESINSLIQSEIHNTNEPYITCGNNIFFEDDKVMTVRNNYDEFYYNGDIWSLKNIVSESEVKLQNKDEISITLKDDYLEDMELAYATTVHKCQGSEADTCIVFLPQNVSKSLKSRSLLYTAITRSKRRLIVIEVNGSLEEFVVAKNTNIRNSDVKNMLEKAI